MWFGDSWSLPVVRGKHVSPAEALVRNEGNSPKLQLAFILTADEDVTKKPYGQSHKEAYMQNHNYKYNESRNVHEGLFITTTFGVFQKCNVSLTFKVVSVFHHIFRISEEHHVIIFQKLLVFQIFVQWTHIQYLFCNYYWGFRVACKHCNKNLSGLWGLSSGRLANSRTL